MTDHFGDRLVAAVAAKGSPVCVGLDPTLDRLPEEVRRDGDDEAGQIESIGRFCRAVLEIVAPVVAAVKIQSAYFERYRSAGVALYERLIAEAQQLGLLVIGDVKRNDIGSTARAYADGHIRAAGSPDAITVGGYFGDEGLAPFADAAAESGKGIFVLVRTSNRSAGAIQDFADAAAKPFYQHMAGQVAALGGGAGRIGRSGYSCVGAVVAATYPDQARQLRRIMPQQIFLVPGYGAQGATAADCAAAFKPDGAGAIVNASRSVIYAYRDTQYAAADWKRAVETAARAFADEIRQAVQPR